MWRAITVEGALASTHAEHRAILRALELHDPDSARLRMGTHLLAVQDFMHEHPTEIDQEIGSARDRDDAGEPAAQ